MENAERSSIPLPLDAVIIGRVTVPFQTIGRSRTMTRSMWFVLMLVAIFFASTFGRGFYNRAYPDDPEIAKTLELR